jgi:hypothetical protein
MGRRWFGRFATAIGGLTSFASAWLNQERQDRAIRRRCFRDATRIGQIATAADGLPGQRAVVEEALSCFDQAAAIRLCDESLAQLARTSLSIPNARLAASS